MKNNRTENVVLGCAVFLAAALCAILARADGVTETRPPIAIGLSDADILVQTVIVEADMHSDADARGILGVLRKRAAVRGVTLPQMAMAYASMWRAKTLTPRHTRILEIRSDCHRPEHYPDRLRWPMDRCFALYALADDALAGRDIGDPFGGQADHWGAPHGSDHDRAMRAGWKRLSAHDARTANAFWQDRK